MLVVESFKRKTNKNAYSLLHAELHMLAIVLTGKQR